MGGHTSREQSKKWDLDRLAKASGLSRLEIEQLYADFIAASGRDGVVDVDEFLELYSHLPYAHSQNKKAMEEQTIRIFHAFDLDHNGTLSFDEFINGIAMMNLQMSENDRIGVLIEENNDSSHEKDQKQISKQYGLQIFRRLNEFRRLPSGTEHQYWKEIDPDNRGYVSHEELVKYIGQPEIYN